MTTYLMADEITGVWEVETLEGEEAELLDQNDFYESLDRLPSPVIACKSDAEVTAKIEQEYGIQFID